MGEKSEKMLGEQRYCSECGTKMSVNAVACPKCGAQVVKRRGASKNTIAGILSFFIPGLGQAYKGHMLRGLSFFLGFWIGVCMLVVPGILVWLWGIYDACVIEEV
jgi:predicted RNA-binding Zn-ribbon protein involved in translation (DUF1610 family)